MSGVSKVRKEKKDRSGKTPVVAAALITLLPAIASAEVVDVKYRGPVDLDRFSCTEVTRSSLIGRVCYDKPNEYVILNLDGTYYHYCEIDDATVSALMIAPSMGRYFNAEIKGSFDCRTRRVPAN